MYDRRIIGRYTALSSDRHRGSIKEGGGPPPSAPTINRMLSSPESHTPRPPSRLRKLWRAVAAGGAALRHRNFRLFFWGQLISLIGTWMQSLAQSWLVYTLTHSAFQL